MNREQQRVAREIFEGGGDLSLELPVPPKSLHPNARAPWQARARDRKQYRQLAGDMAAAQMLEAIGTRPNLRQAVIGLHYVLPWPRNGQLQTHDPDNLIAWGKTAIDALQDAGLLADDREVVYTPPGQEHRTREAIRPPALRVAVRSWDATTCPLCGQAILEL